MEQQRWHLKWESTVNDNKEAIVPSFFRVYTFFGLQDWNYLMRQGEILSLVVYTMEDQEFL